MGQQVQVVEKVNPKEFERMERSIRELDDETKTCYQRKQELEDLLYRGKRDVQEMKRQQGKLRVEVNPLKEQVAMMEKQVPPPKDFDNNSALGSQRGTRTAGLFSYKPPRAILTLQGPGNRPKNHSLGPTP